MVLVLDAEGASEHGAREVGDVTGREHVVPSVCPPVLVDDDAVLDREARRLGELRLRDDPEPGHDCVALERATGSRGDGRPLHRGDRLAGEHLDAPLAVVLGHELAEPLRQQTRIEPVLGDDHRHRTPVRRQRSGDLGADEAAADHDDSRPVAGEPAQPAVVVERAEVDDLAVAPAEAPRPAAGGEQHLLVAVPVTLVVDRAGRSEVDAGDSPGQPEVDSELVGPLPDRALLAAAPELLRQRWTLVGRMRLGADERDRRIGLAFADRLGRLCSGHPAADDQITGVLHYTGIL